MKTYNWAILGTGKIANKMAEALSYTKQSNLYAVGSRNLEKATLFAKKHHFQKAYNSYKDLCNDPKVDIVYIATPHTLHFENTLRCLEKGKHVLCEKPFAINQHEVVQMIAKAKEKNCFLMEAMGARFYPNITKAKEIIDSGTLGDIQFIKADFGMTPNFNPNHRLFNLELAGGSLLDIGIYPVFLSLLLLGNSDEITAFANIGSTGVDENCSMTFKYNTGQMAVLSSSIIANTGTTATICGTKGELHMPFRWTQPGNNFELTLKNSIKKNIEIKMKGNGYNYEAEEVINCLNNSKLQSEIWSWNHSLQLIKMLDTIRDKIELVYKK